MNFTENTKETTINKKNQQYSPMPLNVLLENLILIIILQFIFKQLLLSISAKITMKTKCFFHLKHYKIPKSNLKTSPYFMFSNIKNTISH